MEPLVLIGTAIVSVATVLFVKWYFFSYYIPGIPIKRANSILGYSATLSTKKYRLDSHLVMMKEAEGIGKIFQYYYLGRLMIFISDKYIAKYVLEHCNGKGFFHRGHPKINHRSIFNLDTNAEWKMRRMAFRQSFTMLSLKNFQPELKLLSKKLCGILKDSAEKGTELAIDKVFGLLTVDVICSIAFQYDLKAMNDSPIYLQLHEDIRARFECNWLSALPFADIMYNMPTKFTNRYRNANRNIRAFCYTLLQHVRKLSSEGLLKKESLAQALMDLAKEPGITEDDLCYEILTMFIAGHETTAHTLSFFVYALATHPEVQSKCHSAMDESVAAAATAAGGSSNGDSASTSTMSLLPAYVEATLKESMRKYPVANRGSSRVVNEKEGIVIPKEVLNKTDPNLPSTGKKQHFDHDIVLPQHSWAHVYFHNIHNGAANWGERVDEFLPERFLPSGHFTGASSSSGSSSDGATGGGSVNPLSSPAIYGGGGVYSDDLAFTPFSYGLRNCVGMNLALMEMRVVIADLLKQFSFRLADDSMADERIALETVFTLRPHKMLPVYVSLRK